MKFILSIFLIFCLMLMPLASATTGYSAGIIKSDNPLWNLDLKMERVFENLMITEDMRMNLVLKHADERIGELNVAADKDKVMQEYTKVLNRIEMSGEVKYETMENVRTRLQQHSNTMSQIVSVSAVASPQITNEALIQLVKTQNNLNQKSTETLKAEQVWWSSLVSNYDVSSTPSLLPDLGKYEQHKNLIPKGYTQITVLTYDGSIMNQYVVNNENGIITINEGKTTNAAQTYSFSISELIELKEKYMEE